tara:strand:+ start:9212 stop:10129 length:918 start_codon:yes stop_codon:yes gene_type:complete
MSNIICGTDLRAVHAVPLTPFDAQNRVNLDLYAEHIQRLYAAGTRVFLPAAGTSEFHSLSRSEIESIVATTCQAAGSDAVILAPVGGAIGDALALAEAALSAGASGLMVMPLTHPYLCDQGATDYYECLVESSQMPIVIYKTRDIPSDVCLLKLATNPSIIGIKYAVNQLDQFQLVLDQSPPDCEWLCGSAERFAPYYMLAGATGFTSGAINVCPRLVLALHTALVEGDLTKAMSLQRLILPIEHYRARLGESYSISMLKQSMLSLGYDFGTARAPQRRLTALEREEIETLLRPILEQEAASLVV